MLARDVLNSIPFGQGTAEQDDGLETYFVQTPEFSEVAQGLAHIVLGAKGSGKTAISRVIGSGKLRMKELSKVRPVLAMATQATTLFSRVPETASEADFRQLWLAYCLSLAARDLESARSGRSGNLDLVRDLEDAGLVVTQDVSSADVLKRLVNAVEGREKGISGGDADQSTEWLKPDFDFQPIIAQLDKGFADQGLSCWILLDRLDEAFATRLSVEGPALRGLLRAHLDLLALSERLRTKIFLRSDIFDRVTQSRGFRNLDHITASSVSLKWTTREIVRLLANRIRASKKVGRLRTNASDAFVLGVCIPSALRYFTGRRYQDSVTIDWCTEVTASRPDEASPRNVISLLREAQRSALARLSTDAAQWDVDVPLIESHELTDAWKTVSNARLVDTLYAESHWARPYVETFLHQPERVALDTLRRRFETVKADDGLTSEEVIRGLENIGFLHKASGTLYSVAPLYIPALVIGVGNSERRDKFRVVDIGEPSSPEEARDKAKELTGSGDIDSGINLLLSTLEMPRENAILAANLAIESGEYEHLRKVGERLARDDFAQDLIGKRAAMLFAQGQDDAAIQLFDAVSSDALDEACGHFIGSFIPNPQLEQHVWTTLLARRGWEAPGAKVWESLVPVMAASRVLAVTRSIRGAAPFADAARDVGREWFGQADFPAEVLMDFIDSYGRSFSDTTIQIFAYQAVSIAFVLRDFGVLDEAREEAVILSITRQVATGAEKHQRNFREWGELDELAGKVVARMTR